MDVHTLGQDGPYLIAVLDDHGRYLVDATVSRRNTTASCLYVQQGAVDAHGPPNEILTDKGAGFGSKGEKTSAFDLWREPRGIGHVRTRFKSPTAVGRMERFFGPFHREAWKCVDLEHFRYRYNHVRPHQSPDYRRPALARVEGDSPCWELFVV